MFALHDQLRFGGESFQTLPPRRAFSKLHDRNNKIFDLFQRNPFSFEPVQTCSSSTVDKLAAQTPPEAGSATARLNNNCHLTDEGAFLLALSVKDLSRAHHLAPFSCSDRHFWKPGVNQCELTHHSGAPPLPGVGCALQAHAWAGGLSVGPPAVQLFVLTAVGLFEKLNLSISSKKKKELTRLRPTR